MTHWLLKSEASCYSIDDLAKDKRVAWTGIRNYQARNFMKAMEVGDLCLFYHSSSTDKNNPNGVYGIAKVVSKAHVDETQFDTKDDHYDPKATQAKPIWECVDVQFVKKFSEPVTLAEIKRDPKLRGIAVVEQGSRLSVLPVSKEHFEHIVKLGK